METKRTDPQIIANPIAADLVVSNDDHKDTIVFSSSSYWSLLDILHTRVKHNTKEFKNIFAVPRGGLIPGVYLSHKLEIPMIFNVGQISEDTLVVDDIYETGDTFGKLKGFYDADNLAVLIFKRGMCIVDSILRPTFMVAALDHTGKKWIQFPYE